MNGFPAPRTAGHLDDALRRGGMRTDDDGASRLEGNQNLVDRRGSGVGRGRDRRDHTEGIGDFHDLAFLVAPHDADGAHRPDELEDLLGREEVLLDLVGHDPVAGLFHRQAREFLRTWPCRVGHGGDTAIDLFLRELGQRRGRLFGALRELPGFLNGGQITIGGRGGRSHGCRAPVVLSQAREFAALARGRGHANKQPRFASNRPDAPRMSSADDYKKMAALAALDRVESGMKLGIGSGSTANFFIEAQKNKSYEPGCSHQLNFCCVAHFY